MVIDVGLLKEGEVPCFVPRVAIVILPCAELCRVDEERDSDRPVVPPRGSDQGEVPRVQSSHRRHEAERARQLLKLSARDGDGAGDPHRSTPGRSRAPD